MSSTPRFSRGDEVADRDTGQTGVVVALYDEPGTEHLVAVWFDDHAAPMAVHCDDIVRRQS